MTVWTQTQVAWVKVCIDFSMYRPSDEPQPAPKMDFIAP